MARIRSVKPEFWTDEKIVELSFPARLLFIGLWNFADDDGRMVYSPKRIKMQVFPADTVDISALVGEIRGNSMVETYNVEGIEYLQISNFHKHQRIDKRSPSKLPAPQNSAESPRIPPTSTDLPQSIHESPQRKGREGKGKEGNKENPVAPLALPDWLDIKTWQEWISTRPAKARKEASLKAAIAKLEAFRAQGHDANAIVAESLANGWQGLFPPKGKPQSVAGTRPSVVCADCKQRVFTWTSGRCDPCWRAQQGLAA